MNYIITVTLINFSRRLDERAAANLALISGLFANFQFENDRMLTRKSATFTINIPVSWQTFHLFRGYFTGIGSVIDWEIDNVVEFINSFSFLWLMNGFSLTFFVFR